MTFKKSVVRPQRHSQCITDDLNGNPRPRLCCAAYSVVVYRLSHLFAPKMWLGLPVTVSLVEDNDKERGLEHSVFRHLIAVYVHVTFVYECCHTFYSRMPLHLCHVRRPPWLAGPNSARTTFSQMLQTWFFEFLCEARHFTQIIG